MINKRKTLYATKHYKSTQLGKCVNVYEKNHQAQPVNKNPKQCDHMLSGKVILF